MQAPTAPSGPPAQEPGGRACPACGAANGALAAFCWQCYRPFGAAVAPAQPGPPSTAPYAGGYAGYAGSPRTPGAGLKGAISVPAPSTSIPGSRSRGLGAMLGGLLVSMAVAAGVFFFLNRGPGVELPTSFGGLSQISNAQVDAAIDAFREEAGGGGYSTDMGLYGTAGVPSAALVWVSDPSTPSTDAAFTEFADGFNEGLGTGSLDASRRTTETVGGVAYLCAPIAGSPPANVCMWQVDEIYWILFDLSGSQMGATRALASAANDSVV